MGYVQYGINRNLVERVKKKLKNPHHKEHVKKMLEGVTKEDLQNRAKVKKLLNMIANRLEENIPESEKEAIVNFVLAQKIDPGNTFHLFKLWGMFR